MGQDISESFQAIIGRETENRAGQVFQYLIEQKSIESFIKTDSFSWLDVVFGVDFIIGRIDGSLVPVQVKSQQFQVAHFKAKACFMARFGTQTPVLFVPSEDIFNKKAITRLMRKIVVWKGEFSYHNWEVKKLTCFGNPKAPFKQAVLRFALNNPDKILPLDLIRCGIIYSIHRGDLQKIENPR